ncbi:DUF397 domain-containing protein [Streptomyces sp. DG2A-72]|uniref:DUF397 domain-containing protein n=1 Tax=Streptomyces sp. DG2A-72 TaxID=3051386 RepID=UPI00265C0577|nr:DUF397 domain-containing protein [Streptomyces sp. DG2A-72]MDO0934763.1 DUF397 domain-containing protein [Streptomyces sp. DG2A-72]
MTPESIGPFRKSSYSGAQGDCVEVAATATGGRAVRDSKNQSGPHLLVGTDSWHAFLTGVKDSH